MTIFFIIAVFIIAVFFIIYFAPSSLKAAFTFAPFMPTSKKIIEKALELAQLKPNEFLYDLGSGTGKVLVISEKNFKAKGVGIEYSTPFFIISKINLFLQGVKQSKVYNKSFLDADLSKADVIFMFLTPKAFRLLENKIKTEVKLGTRIVTFSSPLLSLTPEKIEPAPGTKEKIFLYRII